MSYPNIITHREASWFASIDARGYQLLWVSTLMIAHTCTHSAQQPVTAEPPPRRWDRIDVLQGVQGVLHAVDAQALPEQAPEVSAHLAARSSVLTVTHRFLCRFQYLPAAEAKQGNWPGANPQTAKIVKGFGF